MRFAADVDWCISRAQDVGSTSPRALSIPQSFFFISLPLFYYLWIRGRPSDFEDGRNWLIWLIGWLNLRCILHYLFGIIDVWSADPACIINITDVDQPMLTYVMPCLHAFFAPCLCSAVALIVVVFVGFSSPSRKKNRNHFQKVLLPDMGSLLLLYILRVYTLPTSLILLLYPIYHILFLLLCSLSVYLCVCCALCCCFYCCYCYCYYYH